MQVPLGLLKLSGGRRKVEVDASSVSEAIAALDEMFPGFAARIFTRDGRPHRHVNIYVNKVDVRRLAGRETELADGDEVSIFPAIGGG